jgi:DDE superfamily endonuclease
VQVITAPDGRPLWTSPVRPGREHDTTALREHGEILPLLTAWTDDDLRVLGDLGYEGEAGTITVAFKKPKNGTCTDIQQQFNRAHNAVRAVGERGNFPARDHLQSPAQRQPLPLEHRPDRRSSSRDPAHRPWPHHVTRSVTERQRPLLGKPHWLGWDGLPCPMVGFTDRGKIAGAPRPQISKISLGMARWSRNVSPKSRS